MPHLTSDLLNRPTHLIVSLLNLCLPPASAVNLA